LKSKESDFEPQTVGEHIKKKRLELALTQEKAGQLLGVTALTILYWEHGVFQPAVKHFPAILAFLGYDPKRPSPTCLSERLQAKRRELGWTQRDAARKLGIDPSTWSSWEGGGTIMLIAHRCLVAKFTGLSEAEIYAAMRKRWNDSHGRSTPQHGIG
jgi:transcriptional regulator with XRE-family HTH domain